MNKTRTMKTILVIVRLFYLIALVFIFEFTDAQTIISFDASPDNTMVMKIQDHGLSEKPDMLILIFDSTTLTCEFSDDGLIALYATTQTKDKSSIASSYSCYLPEVTEKKDKYSQESPGQKVIPEEVDKEEPILIEEWMLRPNEWN